MIDFRKLMTPQARNEIAQDDKRMMAFQDLGTRDKVATLMEAVRTLQDSGAFNSDQRYSYDEWAIYRVIPAVARKLDPSLELRKTEIPEPEEADDKLTFVGNASVEDLLRMATSILENTRLSRGVAVGGDVRDAAHLVIGDGSRGSAFAITLDALVPGSFPYRHKPDTRPPLTGFYLIGRDGGRDFPIQYCDTLEQAQDLFSLACDIKAGEDVDEAVSAQAPTGFRQRLARRCAEIEVQSADGSLVEHCDIASKLRDAAVLEM